MEEHALRSNGGRGSWPHGWMAVLAQLLAAQLIATPAGRAQSCPAQWLPGDGLPGLDGTVYALAIWDPDGAGPLPPVMVLGGQFTIVGDAFAANIASWN